MRKYVYVGLHTLLGALFGGLGALLGMMLESGIRGVLRPAGLDWVLDLVIWLVVAYRLGLSVWRWVQRRCRP